MIKSDIVWEKKNTVEIRFLHAHELTHNTNEEELPLVTKNIINPIIKHFDTKEDCLNIQLFHLRNHIMDLDNIRSRQNILWNWILRLSAKMLYWTRLYPIRVRYGDDTAIPDEVVKQIRQTMWNHSVIFQWQKGDVLILDNIATAHARLNITPPRKIYTAFGDMCTV